MSAASSGASIDDPVADEVISIDCSVSSVRYEDRGGICYLIQPGDSLWRIAERIYGSPTYWRAIQEANRRRVSKRDHKILVGFGLELPLIRVPLIDGVCQPCPDPAPSPGVATPDAPPTFPPTTIGPPEEGASPPPQGTSTGPGGPDAGEAIELLNPALKFDADLVTLRFETQYATVEVKLKGEFVLERHGSLQPHTIELSKDSIKVAYECALEDFCSKFSLDLDATGNVVLEHELFSVDWSWGSTSVSFVSPRSWKFVAGPKEPIKLTWEDYGGDAYDLKVELASFEAVVTPKEPLEPTAPAPVAVPSWSTDRALEYGLYGLGAVAAVALAVVAAPVVVPAITAAGAALAGMATAEAGMLAAGAAAVLLFTTAREDFDMLEDWPVAAPGGT